MYKSNFYASRDIETAIAAQRVLKPILEITDARSICDVGCGVGTWLRIAQQNGVADIAGYEGLWLDKSQLVIDASLVTQQDLELSIRAQRRYDLVICLEVAEHLSSDRAAGFVAELAALSDSVLFSAAIPNQGGTGHRNEQWQSYWADLFATNGLEALDIVRPLIWQDREIPFWYRQNTILYVHPRTMSHATRQFRTLNSNQLDVVHPELYLLRTHPSFSNFARLLKGLAR